MKKYIEPIRRGLGRIQSVTSRVSVDSCVRTLENAAKDLDATAQSLTARANRRYEAAARLEKQGDEDTIQSERALRVLKRLDSLLA
jgi:hypothetical protein